MINSLLLKHGLLQHTEPVKQNLIPAKPAPNNVSQVQTRKHTPVTDLPFLSAQTV